MKINKKRILIVGSDSLIGKKLFNQLRYLGHKVYETSRRKSKGKFFLDLEDLNSNLFFLPKVDIVVICAAMTKINECEKNPDKARKINFVSPIRIANYYLKQNSRIIFLSTSAVFSGSRQKLFPNSVTRPKTIYGKTKADTEKSLIKCNGNIAIARLSKIINKENSIFSSWLNQLKSGKKIQAFKDHFFCAINLDLVLKILLKIIFSSKRGIYNISSKNDISYFKAANLFALLLNKKIEYVIPESIKNSKIDKKNVHKFTSLNCQRTIKDFKINLKTSENELKKFIKIST